MWLDDQSHREEWKSHRFHQGGPTNLRTVNPEFGIDATREELSILTVLPNPIASGLGVLHRPAIDPQDFSRPRVPDPAGPAPGVRAATADWEPSGRTGDYLRPNCHF